MTILDFLFLIYQSRRHEDSACVSVAVKAKAHEKYERQSMNNLVIVSTLLHHNRFRTLLF